MRANSINLLVVRVFGACLAMTMLHACQHYKKADAQSASPNQEKAMQALSLKRNADANAVAAAKKQCTALGGRLQQAGRMGRYACYAQYSDGGKVCSDDADCQGDCRAVGDAPMGQRATGQCTASNNPFGCYARVENGIVGPTICVD